MLQEAFKKLDDAAARVEKGEAFLEDSPEMKFISRTLSKTDVGYLCHGSVHPSCLTLVMTTAISKVKVGARIVLDVKGPASKVRDQVLVCVRYPQSSKEETCREDNFQFSVTLPCEGQYTVTATLYKENIVGSPLFLYLKILALNWGR